MSDRGLVIFAASILIVAFAIMAAVMMVVGLDDRDPCEWRTWGHCVSRNK